VDPLRGAGRGRLTEREHADARVRLGVGGHHGQEGVDDRGVEVAPAFGAELLKRLAERPAALVAASGDEGVEDVADRADARRERDVLPPQPGGVALAVPALVVGERDRLGHLEQR